MKEISLIEEEFVFLFIYGNIIGDEVSFWKKSTDLLKCNSHCKKEDTLGFELKAKNEKQGKW